MDEGSSGDFTVELSDVPSEIVTVTITGHAETYLTLDPQLTFESGGLRSKTVTVNARHDPDLMDDIVTLKLSAQGDGFDGQTASVTVTVNDDDMAEILAPPFLTVPEGGSAPLQVVLSAQPTETVTVAVTGYLGAYLTPAPLTLTFTTTNWWDPKTVTLNAAKDDYITND